MPLRCPFCNASEEGRIEGMDESGKAVTLVMFNCPFYFRFPKNLAGTDRGMQDYLAQWREREGDAWLESVGPVMKQREISNMEKYRASVAS